MENELGKNTETVTEQTNNTSTADLEARIKQLEAENGKLRQATTNASADASKWKKQYQEMLPEKERLEKQQEEQTAAMQKELDALKAERNVANYKAQLVAQDIGFDAELAQTVAEAMNGGNVDMVMDGLRKFIVAHDKALKEASIRNNQTLPGGSAEKTITQAEFHAMDYEDRVKLFNEQPDLYKELMKKE